MGLASRFKNSGTGEDGISSVAAIPTDLSPASTTTAAKEPGPTAKMQKYHDFELLSRGSDDHQLGPSTTLTTAPSVATPAVEYKTYKRRWFGLCQIMLMNIIVSWDWLTFAPVSAKAAIYYKVSETAINWFSIAFVFAFIPAAPIVVHTLHRGPKPAVMASAALLLAGNWIRYAGSFRSDDEGGIYSAAMVGQVLTGFAQPFVLAAPTRYSDLWFSTRGRVAATALMSLANPLGAALGQLLVPMLAGEEPRDMSKTVLYVSVIATIAALPSFFIPAGPPTPAAPSSRQAKPRIRDSLWTVARSREIWLVLIPFWVMVGLFNNISSLVGQMMVPYGYTEDEAGIGGGVLILVGLIAAAVASPTLDRTKAFLPTIQVLVPISGLAYLVFIWMPGAAPPSLVPPYLVLAILGAAGFILVPCALELLAEWSYPASPEITATVAWTGGQLLGGLLVLVSDAMKAGPDADPPANLDKALVLQAVLGLVMVPLVLVLGRFGRRDKIILRRVDLDTTGPRTGDV